ncbi:hypothetical protein ACFLSJ_02845 [Verrucomicrobiota bacterium]
MKEDQNNRISDKPEYELRNTVVLLIGIPAVGKYTTAKEICRLTCAKLVDNMLIAYPIVSIIGFDGMDSFPFPSGAVEHIERIRDAVLTVIHDYCPPDDSFVFTNVLEAGKVSDEEQFHRIEKLAIDRGASFFPVWLTCNEDKIRERKVRPDRRARFKDTDVSNVARISRDVKMFEPRHPNALTVDTSEGDCGQTARRIIAHIQQMLDNHA